MKDLRARTPFYLTYDISVDYMTDAVKRAWYARSLAPLLEAIVPDPKHIWQK